MLRILLFTTGLILSTVAAFYSVTGLAFVFAGAFWPIIIMGSTLECAKLVAASWLFRGWRQAPKFLVAYLSVGVILLMVLTGVGIFGYLSRAYLIQQAPLTQIATEIASAERAMSLAQAQYDRDAQTLQTLQSNATTAHVITQLSDAQRLSGANGAVSLLRVQQNAERDARAKLDATAKDLAAKEQTLATLRGHAQVQSADLGPLMFAAEAWYGTKDTATMDRVVRWFILLIMLVFDPMAIALLLAAQQTVTTRETTAVTPAPSTFDYRPWLGNAFSINDHRQVRVHSASPSPSAAPDEAYWPTDTESIASVDLSDTTIPVESPKTRHVRPRSKAATPDVFQS